MPEASNHPEQPNQAGEPDALAGPPLEVERALRRELGALFDAAVAPPSVGAALARAAAGSRPKALPTARHWARFASVGLAAAAAMAVVFYGLRVPLTHDDESSTSARTASVDVDVADFDSSGRVDVWDAYLVARALEGGAELARALDLDGDGAVTRTDADLIAQRAVEFVR